LDCGNSLPLWGSGVRQFIAAFGWGGGDLPQNVAGSPKIKG
jgi:hypothetical protein